MTYTTLAAVDSDRWACETYRANFPGVAVRCATVADTIRRLPKADVYLGGPPCQSFSTAGKGEGEEDERNAWPDMIAAIDHGKPRMFLCENVPGMLTSRHLAYTQSVYRDLAALGYVVETKLLDAVDFGVPQFRKRLWWWGIRKDVYASGVRHVWPKPTHQWPWPEPGLFGESLRPAVTVGQALGIETDIRRIRGSGVVRRDHGADEPCPTVMASSQAARAGCAELSAGNGRVVRAMRLRCVTLRVSLAKPSIAATAQGVSTRPCTSTTGPTRCSPSIRQHSQYRPFRRSG